MITTDKELLNWKDTTDPKKWVVFSLDTETNNQTRYYGRKLTEVSICNGYESVLFTNLSTNQSIVEALKQILRTHVKGKGLTIIMHNAKFDASVLEQAGLSIYNADWFCTQVAHHLLDENEEHGLKHLTRTILNKNPVTYEESKKSQEKYYDYVLEDAINTWLLYEEFNPRLKAQGLHKLFYKLEMPFQRCIVEMERTGFYVDPPEIPLMEGELKDKYLNLLIQLHETSNKKYSKEMLLNGDIRIVSDVNFNSPDQLSKILYEELKLIPPGTTPSGKPITGSEAIKKLEGQHPLIEILSDFKVVSKLLTAFLQPMTDYVDPDNRIRCEYHATGTVTGRLSSSKPNLQQLPNPKPGIPNIRNLFKATPGHKLIVLDYSGQEIAVMAQVSQDPTLIEALNKGQDLHLRIANQFYQLRIPEEKLYTTHAEYETIKETYKKQRYMAKSITFGLSYGKTAYGFSKDFNITEEQAQRIVDEYFKSMPLLQKSILRSHQAIQNQGYVETLIGRRRRFKKNDKSTYDSKAFRQAFNFIIQGSSADMIKAAGIKFLNAKTKHPEWNLKLIGTVHDEWIVEVKEPYAEKAKKELTLLMQDVPRFVVPVTVNADIGNTYADAK